MSASWWGSAPGVGGEVAEGVSVLMGLRVGLGGSSVGDRVGVRVGEKDGERDGPVPSPSPPPPQEITDSRTTTSITRDLQDRTDIGHLRSYHRE